MYALIHLKAVYHFDGKESKLVSSEEISRTPLSGEELLRWFLGELSDAELERRHP